MHGEGQNILEIQQLIRIDSQISKNSIYMCALIFEEHTENAMFIWIQKGKT